MADLFPADVFQQYYMNLYFNLLEDHVAEVREIACK